MPSTTHDDGFHEIQLNGKQLVFLFMAVTVVSVVIFLSGVLVGRGVRLERGGPGQEVGTAAVIEPAAELPAATGVLGDSSQPSSGAQDTSYRDRLVNDAPGTEKLAAEEPPAKVESLPEPPLSPLSAPAVAAKASGKGVPAPAPAAEPTRGSPAASLEEPRGAGIAIQVSAFRQRRDADVLASRLAGKGFAAYVVEPSPGAPALFRVRVGKFKERREADAIAARLKKEEQLNPWILR